MTFLDEVRAALEVAGVKADLESILCTERHADQATGADFLLAVDTPEKTDGKAKSQNRQIQKG